MSIKTVADLKCPWFHARGTRVYDVKQEWQNTQFVTVLEPSEYQAGDNYLMQCALGFRTDAQWRDYFNKAGNFGVTARGLISFGDAYTKLLQAHKMKTGTGGPAGITFTGYNNAVGSIESKGKGALILGTTIVGRLALSLSKEWVSVQVGYYDIPCLGSGNEVVSCRVRETDFSIRRPHKKGVGVVESDEDIITKFLKFGLSLSDMSFPNVCELIVYCGQPVNGTVDMGKIVGELDKATQKKVPYANPNIIYNVRKGNSVVKMESLLRPLTEELTSKLRDCKYQPSFFGKTGNAYWGDYLVNRSMQTPFDFGATVEETAVNCIDYCNKHRWGNYTKQEDAAKDFDNVEWESDVVEEQAVQDDSFDDMEWEDDATEGSTEDFDAVEWEDDTAGLDDLDVEIKDKAEQDFSEGWCGYFQVPFVTYDESLIMSLVGKRGSENATYKIFKKLYVNYEKYVTQDLYDRLLNKIVKNVCSDKFGLIDSFYGKETYVVQQFIWVSHLISSSLTYIGTAANMRWPLGVYSATAGAYVGKADSFEKFFGYVDADGCWNEIKFTGARAFETVDAYLRDFELDMIRKAAAEFILRDVCNEIKTTHKIASRLVQNQHAHGGNDMKKVAEVCRSFPKLMTFYSTEYNEFASGLSSAYDLFEVARVAKSFSAALYKLVTDMRLILNVMFSVNYGDDLVSYFVADRYMFTGDSESDWKKQGHLRSVVKYYAELDECMRLYYSEVQSKLAENLK